MKRSRFVIYTHNFSSISVPSLSRTRRRGLLFCVSFAVGDLVLRMARMIGNLLFQAAYFVGLGFLTAADALMRRTVSELSETKENFRKRFFALRGTQFRTGFLLFAGFVLAVAGLFKTADFIAVAQLTKERVMNVALSGDKHLRQAKDSIQGQDLNAAQSNFLQARDRFRQSQAELASLGSVTNSFLDLLPQKRDAQRLLEASEGMSEAGNSLVNFYKEVSNLRFTQAGLAAEGVSTRSTLENSNRLLAEASGSVSRAREKLAGVDANILPEDRRAEFTGVRQQLETLDAAIVNFREIFALLTEVFSGNKTVLLLMQNNNELRSTGGFIGTYGELRLVDGRIDAMHISSIYDLDGQLDEIIAPPTPVLAVNDRWFLRDSNWFADFPLSAQKAAMFYEKEGGETPDLILAMSTTVMTELLRVTGPIEMPSYGVTFDAENFVERAQAISTQSGELPTNEPKRIFADFFPVLLQRLSELPAEKKAMLLEVMQRSLSQKEILAYSREPAIQNRLDAFGWSGRVRETDRDYLMVVANNLGGTKTDLAITQTTNLTSEIQADGSILNTLKITRTNHMPKMEPAKNTGFIRALVPEGSELVSTLGFDRFLADAQAREGSKRDPEAFEWDKSAVRDLVSGTVIGKESGKTFFGNWVVLEGGESRTVEIVYRLPLRLKTIDRFSLLYQKQPGIAGSMFQYTIAFPNRQLEWSNFSAKNLEASSLTTESNVTQDEFYGMVFRKRD